MVLTMEVLVMAKLNVSIDDRLRDELFKLVPPRRRSQVVNEALENELRRRKRKHSTETVHRLRKRSATLSEKEIVEAVRRDRMGVER
jgi:metal-responsive CopG/Arc/MetJ family transcriptional regulator